MGRAVPKRWRDYKCHGDVIKNTKIIVFKVPLKIETCRKLLPVDQFTPEILMHSIPNLKFIIDLTDTTRYYRKTDFTSAGIKYIKVEVPGRLIPTKYQISKFIQAMEDFMAMAKDDELIGVHCTHGLNRTGFMVCQYLVRQLGWSATYAIKEFEIARGHAIEREPYLRALMSTSSGVEVDPRIGNNLIDKNNDRSDNKSRYSRWDSDKINLKRNYSNKDDTNNQKDETDRKSRNSRINCHRELPKNWRNNISTNSQPTTSSSSSSSSSSRARFDYYSNTFYPNWHKSSQNDSHNNPNNVSCPEKLCKSNLSFNDKQNDVINLKNSSSKFNTRLDKGSGIQMDGETGNIAEKIRKLENIIGQSSKKYLSSKIL